MSDDLKEVNFDELVCIPDYQGRKFSGYRVSLNEGKVWSLKSNKWLSGSPISEGKYLALTIMDDKRNRFNTYVHRLCLAGKLQNWDWIEVEHVKGNPQNNCADNLAPLNDHKQQFDDRVRALMSLAKQGQRHHRSKFTNDQVKQIRIEFDKYRGRKSEFMKEAATKFECNYMTIYLICKRKSWKHVAV